MYQSIKTCIRKGNEYSEFFNCEIGVEQGVNLSPFLFSLYLNDLEILFGENNVNGLESISAKFIDHNIVQNSVRLIEDRLQLQT
jgi:hypothetical protein